MQSIEKNQTETSTNRKTNNIKGIGNPQYFQQINKATQKQEFNNFILEYFNKYESIQQFKEIDLYHLLESNQEVYNTECIEILEQNDPYFNHELIIPEAEILTAEIQEELIDLEYDFYFNEKEAYNFNMLCYDIVLDKNIFEYFMQKVEDQNEYFLYENNNLIITDLYNFLLDNGYNDYYFNSETLQDLKESIAEEIQKNYNEIIENIYNNFNYYYMVYEPAKDQYTRYNYYDELQTINKDLQKLYRTIKEYIVYNEKSNLFIEYHYKISKKYLQRELTEQDINPIKEYTNYNELNEITKKYLRS
jgi:hypothetical protein